MKSKLTPYKFIKMLRESCPDVMIDVFTQGSCYRLFKILQAVFPQAQCYYDHIVGHVYTEIDGRFYDIHGWHKKNPKWEKVADIYGNAHFDQKAMKWMYEPPKCYYDYIQKAK